MAGWIKVHRSLFKHWVCQDPMYMCGWITMLATVNWEPAKVVIKGKLFTVNRGDSVLSLASWAKILPGYWTVKRVRTFFNLLESDGMITRHATPQTTWLSIVNYNSYQDQGHTEGTQEASKGQAEGKVSAHDIRREEGKEGEEESRKRFSPPSIEELNDHAKSKGETIDAQAFIDFYSSKDWYVGKNKMKNWKSAASGWIRRQKEFERERMTPQQREQAAHAEAEKRKQEADFDALMKDLEENGPIDTEEWYSGNAND